MANWDQAEGELKEQGGRLTGDEELEREGEAQGAWGDVKDTADDAKDKAGDAWDDAKEKL
ncbi:MAG TPA: CsbD family protein [Gaiellaceae bacterium]|jgi:uncharacterized protein YjbJ (UPF0337 family)|nr:CsbD family protein [Gaiellaceae bacterium]